MGRCPLWLELYVFIIFTTVYFKANYYLPGAFALITGYYPANQAMFLYSMFLSLALG